MQLPRPLLLLIVLALNLSPSIDALNSPHKKAHHGLSDEQKQALAQAQVAPPAGALDPMNVVREGDLAGHGVGGTPGLYEYGEGDNVPGLLVARGQKHQLYEREPEPQRTPVVRTTTTSTSTSTSTTPTTTSTTAAGRTVISRTPLPTVTTVSTRTVLSTTTSVTSTTTTTTTTSTSSSSVLGLPTQPAGACASLYRDTSAGAVYGPGLGTFPMSPRPSTFVYRSGRQLYLDGALYRVVGPNIYWLGLDENVVSSGSYPDKARVREAMAQAVAMGANTIRAHTLGISTGNALSVWPSAYNTNNAAFDAIDYAIFAARNYGLRLIIPLTDNYKYYHGGKFDFLNWAGVGTDNPNLFYTNQNVVNLFTAYISVLLNHVNTYTGVPLRSDPTIMAWETGNELGGYMLGTAPPPAAWTSGIAQYIKAVAPNHLVLDGSDGLVNSNGVLTNTGVNVGAVDMVTDHFYPLLDWLLTKDQGIMNNYPNTNFLVGEFDWTQAHGGDSLANFFSIVESIPGSGSMFWSLFGHDPQCCNWITHNDGYSMLYPNGNGDSYTSQILQVTQHWHRMRGMAVPSALPAVACPQPALLP